MKERLLTTLNRRKMAFVEHVLRGKDISTDLFMGMVYGKRGRGRPKTRYSNNVKEIADGRGLTDLYRVSQKKRPAFERLLLPDYISNDNLQYLIT